MGMFEYVVVLTGVVIGLALTHLMQGVARIIEQPDRVRVWWVHLGWVGYMFVNAVFWWWWEFRLRLIANWTFQLYAFVLGYAFLIYLICAVLVPSDVATIQSYKEYFVGRRRWFFGMLIAWLAIDFVDTWAKGSAYFASLGIEYPIAQAGLALVCLIGLLSPRERVQILVLLLVIAYQASRIVRFFDVVQQAAWSSCLRSAAHMPPPFPFRDERRFRKRRHCRGTARIGRIAGCLSSRNTC